MKLMRILMWMGMGAIALLFLVVYLAGSWLVGDSDSSDGSARSDGGAGQHFRYDFRKDDLCDHVFWNSKAIRRAAHSGNFNVEKTRGWEREDWIDDGQVTYGRFMIPGVDRRGQVVNAGRRSRDAAPLHPAEMPMTAFVRFADDEESRPQMRIVYMGTRSRCVARRIENDGLEPAVADPSWDAALVAHSTPGLMHDVPTLVFVDRERSGKLEIDPRMKVAFMRYLESLLRLRENWAERGLSVSPLMVYGAGLYSADTYVWPDGRAGATALGEELWAARNYPTVHSRDAKRFVGAMAELPNIAEAREVLLIAFLRPLQVTHFLNSFLGRSSEVGGLSKLLSEAAKAGEFSDALRVKVHLITHVGAGVAKDKDRIALAGGYVGEVRQVLRSRFNTMLAVPAVLHGNIEIMLPAYAWY